MRHLRPLLFVLVSCLSLGTSGCGLSSALPSVIGGIGDAALIVQQIEGFVGSFYRQHPNPAQQAEIDTSLATVRDALIVAERALAGTVDISSKDVTAAFVNFSTAYAALMKLVGAIGVQTAPAAVPTGLQAVAGGPKLFVPEPRLLRLTAQAPRGTR